MESNITVKPWGFYVDVLRQNDVVMKKIVVFPNEELSYQYHYKREEFWFVSSGTGVFTFDDEDCKVSSGMSLVIPLGSKHMIRNDGKEDLIIFEMQCGVCEEDDIVRITDKYNR
tara:strand:- start:924 stop:1265 length:342 start_codon:yes stop_codon:yes gene_type:complete